MNPSQRVVKRYLEATRVTRHLGTCALCGREIKVPGGKLAHHGYQRPGYGFIQGSCPGTGHKPFEVSPVTAEIGRDMAESRIATYEQILKELPTATELMLSVRGRVQKVMQTEYTELEWKRLIKAEIDRREYGLKEASRLLDHYKQLVSSWKPAEVKSVDEAVRKKEERQEKDRQSRMERYVANRTKTVDRLKKAFSKLQRAEKGLKSEKKPAKIAKYLKEAASAAEVMYRTLDSKPAALAQNYPGLIDRDAVIAEWGMDDAWKHLGAIKGNSYISSREADELAMQAYIGNQDAQSYLWDGLDYWAPFWPGWRGQVHVPEDTAGENRDRISWPK